MNKLRFDQHVLVLNIGFAGFHWHSYALIADALKDHRRKEIPDLDHVLIHIERKD